MAMDQNQPESRALVVPAGTALAIERDPNRVLAEAHKAAAALQDVLKNKPKKVMMGGEQYLEFEDWQTLARFYGVTAKGDGDPEFVEIGPTRGFKASAVAITREGQIISRATAFCLSDEEKWGERPKYVYGYVLKDGGWSAEDPGTDQMQWEPYTDPKTGQKKNRPKKERRQVANEKVPLFQLSSMAQTRACAKALRNILSWVVVLAGYKATPAEELDTPANAPAGSADTVDGEFHEVDAAPSQRSQPASRPQPRGEAVETITDANDPRWVRWIKLCTTAKNHSLQVPRGLDKVPAPVPAINAASKALIDGLARAGVDVAEFDTAGGDGDDQDAEDLQQAHESADQEALAL